MESVKLVLGTSEYIDVMPMAAGREQSKLVAKLAPPVLQPRLAGDVKLNTNDACTQITRMLLGCP